MINIKEEILRLKKERNAVIAAHYYQNDDVQEIADIIGDSFMLSKHLSTVKEEVIVMCGVRFMAESAKILSPQKNVLLPVEAAGCPMADMATKEAVTKMKKKYPEAAVVCYVNSSAEVKAESDICCTSSNAVNVVKSLKEKDIIFVPDKNLGSYVAKLVPEKNFIYWDGYCPIHNNIDPKEADVMKAKYPNAILTVHPECKQELVVKADFVGSTKQIIDYCTNSQNKEFIIGTEEGILYQLKKQNPDKSFYMLTNNFICQDMKKINIQDVYCSLMHMQYEINLDAKLIEESKATLEKMLLV